MATFARRARRAQHPRPYHAHAAHAVPCPSRPRPEPLVFIRHIPHQALKVVYGLKSDRYGMTFIGDDSTLMDMDAPECLPAGSHTAYQPMPDSDPGFWIVRETIAFRGGFPY